MTRTIRAQKLSYTARFLRLKLAGYLLSWGSVLLLAMTIWQTVAGNDFLKATLIGGVLSSLGGMALRWKAFRDDHDTPALMCSQKNRGRPKVPALVVEDDMLVAWAVSETLERGGFDPVMVATTDVSAAAALETGNVGLLVCDLDLGTFSTNGWAVLNSCDPSGKIPTLIYSALDPELVLQRLRESRPTALFIPKPAPDDELLRAALNVCGV